MAVSTFSPVLATSTLSTYLSTKIEPIYERSFLMAGMKTNGRIGYSYGGKDEKTYPRVSRRVPVAVDPNNPRVSFPSRNTKIEAVYQWVSMVLGEKITRFDVLANKGKAALFPLVKTVMDEMAEDFTYGFNSKLYGDGSATGSKELWGLETLFSSTTSLISGGFVGDPAGTYAGQSMALGSLGGSWSGGTWPNGSGSTQYKAWSPLVVDYNNSSAAAQFAGDTWAENWQDAMNAGITYLGRLQSSRPNAAVVDSDLLRVAKSSTQGSDRFLVNPNTRISNLGHQTVLYEGVEISDDYDCTPACGYLFNWKEMMLKSMQSTLVGYKDDFDIETNDQLYRAEFWGQFEFSGPSKFAKLAAISAAGS